MLYNRTNMKKYNCYSEKFPNLPFTEKDICPKLAKRIKEVYKNYCHPQCCCRKCCKNCGCTRINCFHFGDNIINIKCCKDNPTCSEKKS